MAGVALKSGLRRLVADIKQGSKLVRPFNEIGERNTAGLPPDDLSEPSIWKLLAVCKQHEEALRDGAASARQISIAVDAGSRPLWPAKGHK
ncbi:hypothetical protein AJ87_35955 [Rhizobium yanglingense]|nr:hypothetical protein AJ87_35955 [Rhizobium yanglingense]